MQDSFRETPGNQKRILAAAPRACEGFVRSGQTFLVRNRHHCWRQLEEQGIAIPVSSGRGMWNLQDPSF